MDKDSFLLVNQEDFIMPGKKLEIVSPQKQLEEKIILLKKDIKKYEKITGKKQVIEVIEQRYAKPHQTDEPKFTIIKGKIYQLPYVEDEEHLIYAVIDKYLYERNRHKREEEPCLTLRHLLEKIEPGAFKKKDEYFKEKLKAAETEFHTFFGECPSDDSDSDEEEFRNLTKVAQKKKLTAAQKIKQNILPKVETFQKHMKAADDSPKPEREKRPLIHHPEEFDREQAEADLETINEQLILGEPLTSKFLSDLTTKFFVAEYRGIHYVTSAWDADARRSHRDLNEVGSPQFSSSVFVAAGINNYREYLEKLKSDPQFLDEITKTANEVQKKLLAMQHTSAVSYDNYTYISAFHLLQYWYTSDYDGYEKKVKKRIDAKSPLFYTFLLNAKRPFLSTADLPLHALLYAYGLKLYEGHKDERLRPKWHKDGKAERPYSGKVYVSVHPLTDFTKLNPSHITSWFRHGFIPIDNLVAAERETSFLGYMHKDRVVLQHKAKYPSFKGDYKSIYAYKYGIDKPMYEVLQEGFKKHPPHSTENRALKKILGDYLCAYQEVRLIEEARKAAESQGKVLIYRDKDGLFSLDHPKTPSTRVAEQKKIIMAKRALYEAVSESGGNTVKAVDQELFEEKMKAHYKKESKHSPLPLKETERFRFFNSKQELPEDAKKYTTLSPVPMLTGFGADE